MEDGVINGHAGHLLEGAVIKQLYSLYCSLNILAQQMPLMKDILMLSFKSCPLGPGLYTCHWSPN